jgi:hypothetical protein
MSPIGGLASDMKQPPPSCLYVIGCIALLRCRRLARRRVTPDVASGNLSDTTKSAAELVVTR